MSLQYSLGIPDDVGARADAIVKFARGQFPANKSAASIDISGPYRASDPLNSSPRRMRIEITVDMPESVEPVGGFTQ